MVSPRRVVRRINVLQSRRHHIPDDFWIGPEMSTQRSLLEYWSPHCPTYYSACDDRPSSGAAMWKTCDESRAVTHGDGIAFCEWIRQFACWICISVLFAVCTSWVVSNVCVVLFFINRCIEPVMSLIVLTPAVPLRVSIVLKYNTADVVWKLQVADLPAGSVL